MMRQSLSGVVVLAALVTTAAAADLQPVLKAPPTAVEQQATGYVELYSGFANSKDSFMSIRELFLHGWALGGAGRANYWISRDVSVQVDAQAEGTSYNNPGNVRFSSHSDLVGGHWSWRNSQQYLFGLFAAAGDSGSDSGLAAGSVRHGLIGAEAQWYWNQFTLYAQGGYDSALGKFNPNSSTDLNAWFIRGTGRYFVNPNFLIEGTLMYANGNVNVTGGDLSFGVHTWTWGVKGEWRLPTGPFSAFAKYQGSETHSHASAFDEKVHDHRVLLGLKLHLGDRTLQQVDRSGATLDILSPLADPTSPLMFSSRL